MPFTNETKPTCDASRDYGSPVKQMTPYDRLHGSVERLDVIASNLVDTARRIAGPISTRDSAREVGTNKPAGDSLFDALDALSERLQSIATVLDDANSVVTGRL